MFLDKLIRLQYLESDILLSIKYEHSFEKTFFADSLLYDATYCKLYITFLDLALAL